MTKVLILCAIFISACGSTGSQGTQGSQGSQGAPGPAGSDGTAISVVQFCPDSVPVYPSTFPESGVCVNGNLYGVYSANGGFLALLSPGAYSSAGVGSSCNFTILPNCQLQ